MGKKKGKFIVFEGTDGSGKSTQLGLLARYLENRGEEVFVTSEPTNSPFGALLRDCLKRKIETDEKAIAALFAADRLDHILEMKRQLAAGKSVLCDRYYLSSFAYNGGFVPLDWVIQLNSQAMEELRPDLVIYIDLSPEEAMARISRRGEAERYETLEKQRAIRARYFEMFERFKDSENIAIVNGEEDKDTIHARVCAAMDEFFGG